VSRREPASWNRRAVEWLDERLYPGVANRWDDSLLRERVLALLRPSHTVLDLGAGAGIVPQMDFRGRARSVCGVDPDPRVLDNPHLDEGRLGVGERVPWPDQTFDLAFADNVLEHLDDPESVFREVRRVLKPGGRFVVKTPNLCHYMPLVARLSPTSFHRFVNRLRGRAVLDTFPTRYRTNTPAALRRHAAAAGLEIELVERHEGRPEYLRLSPATYVAGWLYERSVNAFAGLEPFRLVLIATLRRPTTTEEARDAHPAAQRQLSA
jgi:SAM-dependent methyltransferase